MFDLICMLKFVQIYLQRIYEEAVKRYPSKVKNSTLKRNGKKVLTEPEFKRCINLETSLTEDQKRFLYSRL